MQKLRPALTLAWLPLALVLQAGAQPGVPLTIEGPSPESRVEFNTNASTFVFFNRGIVKYQTPKYQTVVLAADGGSVNWETGEAVAEGHVRIQQGAMTWVGDRIQYNFKTYDMEAGQFRAGQSPVFATGRDLRGNRSNDTYTAHDAYLTSDDIAHPAEQVHASTIKIVPGKYIEAYNATLYLGGVPVMYFPYYHRNLGERANNFNFIPGYRSAFGAYLLTRYRWYWNDELDGTMHFDYREKRGVGVGPDLNAHLGQWGEASLKYYYIHDEDAGSNSVQGLSIPENRQRVYFSYLATPFTNLELRAHVRYESDSRFDADFFEGDYRQNPQPSTFVEATKHWDNWSLDTYVQPRVNDFLETVERLPEVKFTSFRQQLGSLPVYYESESSAGYYRRLFADTNGPPIGEDYYAPRGDTYHQLLLPETFFGWLNVTPRVGGRFTAYGETTGPGGGTNEEASRGVFNTGAEVTFKASRVWPGITNSLLDLDGLRHILQPSINYVYVPAPNYHPDKLPQFDSELPSLVMLPIDFPDYNSIDSVDSQNTIRFGLRNKLQTKRDGQMDDLLKWELDTDWRLRTRTNQTTFNDLYSDLIFKPRSWIIFESQTRYDISGGEWRLAFHNLTLQPNDRWSWGIGHWYIKDDFSSSPTALGEGNNLISSTLFIRANENWGFRARQYFEARVGRMQEQSYTVYRDFRSWTGALTFRILDNGTGSTDFAVAATFSLKARPRFGLNDDAVRPSYLLGN